MVNQTHDVYNNTEMTHSHVIIYGNIWFKLGFFSYLSSLADLTDLNEWELYLQIPTAFFQILKSQGKDDAAKQTFETNLDLFEKELGERGALFGGNAKKPHFYILFLHSSIGRHITQSGNQTSCSDRLIYGKVPILDVQKQRGMGMKIEHAPVHWTVAFDKRDHLEISLLLIFSFP